MKIERLAASQAQSGSQGIPQSPDSFGPGSQANSQVLSQPHSAFQAAFQSALQSIPMDLTQLPQEVSREIESLRARVSQLETQLQQK